MKIAMPFLVLRLSLSILLGTAIFLILPIDKNRKVVDIKRSNIINEGPYIHFEDVDEDGSDEMVKGFFSNGFFSIHLVGYGGGPKQFNITCDQNLVPPVFEVGDYNHDGNSEIVCTYSIGDKLFMDIIFPDDEQRTIEYKKIFLDSLKTVPGNEHRFQMRSIAWADLNGDPYDEIILSMCGTYETYYPRKLMAFNMVDKSFISSITLNNMISDIIIFDHDGDGKPEITGPCGAPDNNKKGHDDYPLHDQSAWLLIFDSDLNLINSTPPEFPGINTSIRVFPREINGKTELVGIVKHNYKGTEPDYLIETRNLHELIRKDTVPKPNGLASFEWFPFMANTESEYLAFRGQEYLLFFNSDLSLTKTLRLPSSSYIFEPTNLCDGPEPEIITKDNGSNLFRIYSYEGKLLCEYLFEGMETAAGVFGTTNFIGQNTAYWQVNKPIKYFTLEYNVLFYLRWLILLSIIGILHTFSWVSMLLQQKNARQKEALASKMRKLELATINSRLDPHFTFNSLNVLKYLANSGDNTGVEKFVMHFSKLIRQQMQSSDKPAHKLSDELNLVNHYIQLQKLRYEVPIELDLNVESEVDQNLLIPKTIIHTHIENAIKHGLVPSPGGGTITITITLKKRQTIISIRDNGVGRDPNSEPDYSHGHGQGMKILEQLFDLFYKLHKVRIKQEIKDHVDKDGKGTGTEVVVRVG